MENNDISKLTYSQALSQLEAILEQLRSDSCDVDNLTTLTARAVELLNHCRQRLTTTDQNLQKILQSLLPSE